MLCLGQPEALQPQVNYGNIESAGCAWWGKVGISFYLFFGYSWQSKKNWNFDVNCEKLVFLVLNIVKHIFLAVLYFLAAGSRKAAQMHSDPVNSLHVGNCGKN